MTVVEVLTVIVIVGLLAGIAGIMVSRFNTSRSINDIAREISATVQMAKMRSARDGVEYRAVFARCNTVDDTDQDCKFCTSYTDFPVGGDRLSISLERGNSNKGSTRWCIVSSQTKKMTGNFDLDMAEISEIGPRRFGFGPKGFMVDEDGEPVTTAPVSVLVKPTSTSRVQTCGCLELSPSLGRIRVFSGHWDGTQCCNPIRDESPDAAECC